jgi:hypothetical protein
MANDFIAVLDADACVEAGKVISDGTSHLSLLLLHFKHTYIHEFVRNEIKPIRQTRYKDVRSHVEDLIVSGLITPYSDGDLLYLLKNVLADEGVSCSVYVGFLRTALDMLHANHPLILVYNDILTKSYSTINELLSDLVFHEKKLQSDYSTGEIKTIVLLQVIDFVKEKNEQINLFVSNDKKARKLLTGTKSAIISCSSLASFILLREAGFAKTDCMDYFNTYAGHSEINAIGSDGKKLNTTYQQLYDDIFDSSKKVEMTKQGIVKYC